MQPKATVLWLLKEFGIGGAERLLLELRPHLPGFEFLPVAVSKEPRDIEEEFRDAGMATFNLGATSHLDFRWIPRFIAMRRRVRPDLIHLHNPYPAIGGRIGSLAANLPLVYTEHNVWDRYHPASRVGNALTLSLNDRVIAVSEPVRRSILASRVGRRVAAKIEVIHNGIDVDKVRLDANLDDRYSGHPTYGALGHLRHSKGIDVLLRAAVLIQERLPEASGVVIGGGEDERELVALKQQLGLPSIDFLGVRRDARQLLARLNVFVVPSRHEGLPLALLEAMALGRPIVATRAGGIPDVLTDGKDALLVPSEKPSALAQAILRLLTTPALGTELGKGAVLTVRERFSSAGAAAKYSEMYQALLGREARKA